MNMQRMRGHMAHQFTCIVCLQVCTKLAGNSD